MSAYYNLDTNVDNDEYIKSFDGLITQNGTNNFKDSLVRPSGSNEGIQIQRNIYAVNTYCDIPGNTDATTLSTVYAMQTLTIEEQEPSVTYDPILIKLELKLEDDNIWRVNYISFERSLSTLPMDINELMS